MEKGHRFARVQSGRMPRAQPKQSIHLRLEQDIIQYFKAQGKGHISRMQAVLKAYVDAHRPQAK
jgi:uncharacterized protein (DUF4415 family)